MKMAEFVGELKRAEAETGNFYATRSSLTYMYLDIIDAIEEGYIQGVTADRPQGRTMRAVCEDGVVIITKHDDLLQFETVAYKRYRTASPYDRTRAMVYATGNRWAIENLNATH